jgi:uncharacterized membrane protein YkvI
MIFAALVESGVGGVHAINERIAGALHARHRTFAPLERLLVTGALLAFCAFVATHFGLIDLVTRGYRMLAYIFLAVFVVPLLVIVPVRLVARRWQQLPVA